MIQQATIDLPAKCHLNDDGLTLNLGFFRGSGPVLLKILNFVIFQGGGGGPNPPPPPFDPGMIRSVKQFGSRSG